MLRWATQIHKWLGLVVALQVLGWFVGGLVMTALPIEKVRSEQHAASFRPAALPITGVIDAAAAARAAGLEAVEATLKTTVRGPTVWIRKDAEGGSHIVDALSGRHLPPLPETEARLLASVQYEGPGRPVAVRWLEKPPQEAGRPGPLWRVDFDDREKTSFYLSPDTGEVVSRRSDLWRYSDFWWRGHILDFETGEDFNHPWLVALAGLATAMALAGVVLVWIRLRGELRGLRRRR
jgi:hypothetical protein